MNIEKLLNTIIEAGKMLVESGAEVNRVEETMVRMCRCFEGIEYADSYVTLTGIMFSLTYDNQTMTRICRVHTGEAPPISAAYLLQSPEALDAPRVAP